MTRASAWGCTGVELAPEAEDLRAAVRSWARAIPAETLTEAAERGVLTEATLRELFALGVHRAAFPKRLGGLGLGHIGLAAGLAELAAVDGSLAATVMATVSCATVLHLFGTPRQQRRWLAPLIAGEGGGAVALTEPGAGSDLAAMAARTEATARGGRRLFGEKAFITNACNPLLTVIVTVARAPDGGPACYVLGADAPGLRRTGPLAMVGWTAAGIGELSFDGCPLRAAQILGTEGRGLANTLRALNHGRVAVAAIAAGTARGAFERALAYTRARTSAGGRLSDRDAVRQLLVDLWLRAEQAWMWTVRAATAADRGEDIRSISAMAKLAATESAVANAATAVRLHGARGVRAGGAVARLWGDAKVLEVVEGASEVQRLVLGRALDGVDAGTAQL